MSETSELTGPLLKMLRQAGVMCFRMQSGRVKVRGGWMQLCPNGTADILCFPRKGGVLWLETKAVKRDPHRAQREAQAEFCDSVTAMGHRYLQIRDLGDVLELLK